MSKKNQNNDGRNESLSDEQNDISNSDEVIENSPEDTIESVEEIEEIYEEIADEENADQDHDQNEDQGFEERPVAAHTDGGSGGGMAKTAMGLSMLALAGTGYNLYDSNSSGTADSGESQQAAVDYSSDIASIQEQIKSLMQSQEELTAMATSTQADSDAGSDVATDDAEQVAATDDSAATEENTEAGADESQATDETMAQAESTEATDEAAGEATDEAMTQAESTEASDEVADETTDEAMTQAESTEASDEVTDEAAVEATAETTGEVTDEAMAQAESSESTDTEQLADSQATETSSESEASTEAEEQADTEAVAEEQSQQTGEDSVAADSDAAADEAASTQDDQSELAASALADLESTKLQIQQAQVEALAAIPSGDDIKKLALEQVSVVLDDAKKRLGLNEVAQLLSIGEQRLSLAGDIEGAQAAFGIADQRLSEISDPAVESVRESISSNLAALDSIAVVDKNALTQELTTMAGSIDSLAFKPLETLSTTDEGEQAPAQGSAEQADSEQAPAQESSSADEALSLEGAGQWLKSLGSKVGDTIGDVGSGIAGDLKGMVTIQKTGALNDMVLAPEQQYFIRENIKLQLGSAQRAVLQDNTGVFKQSIAQAGAFLTDFFDTENEDVKSVSARLVELEEINLDLELPDVSAASTSLADVIKQLPSVGSSETNSN